MSTQTLRDLAKSYAKGTIAKESYRKSRTDLIKNIIAGDVIVKDIDYEGPLRPSNDIEEAITEGIERDKTQITGPRQSSEPKKSPSPVTTGGITKKDKSSSLIFIFISVAIVLILILAVILFYPKPPESIQIETQSNINSTANSIASNVTGSTEGSTNTAVAETLLGSFLAEKNWSEANMDKFLQSWAEITLEEKSSVVETKRMQRMKSSIYKQFTEAKALASIDSDKARMKQQKLIDFATTLGIDDSRLVLD
jgi:hypothetical protein